MEEGIVVEKPVAGNEGEKQGSICWSGCCCDFRHAVIIMNGFAIALGVINTIVQFSTHSVNSVPDESNEEYQEELEDNFDTAELAGQIMSIIDIIFTLIALVGAIKYNIYAVFLNVVWMVINLFVSPILTAKACHDYTIEHLQLKGNESDLSCSQEVTLVTVLAASYLVIWAYPHIGFIVEAKEGIGKMLSHCSLVPYCGKTTAATLPTAIECAIQLTDITMQLHT